MASFYTSGLDKMIDEMEKMGQLTGPLAEAMVTAAADEVVVSWKETAEKYELIDTGAMVASIGYPHAVINLGTALARDVYPQGKDAKGVSNAEKAFILHYGKHGYDATYWVDEADALSGPRVQARLEAMWADFLETGKVPAVAAASAASGGGVRKTTKH